MTVKEKSAWTDEHLVEYIRKWAVELSTCRLNAVKHNRIMDRELSPAEAILAARGASALRKLLPLLQDQNPTVRWIAASYGYDMAPDLCRPVLERLMSERSMMGIHAWAVLAHKNPKNPPDPMLIGLSRPSDADYCKPGS